MPEGAAQRLVFVFGVAEDEDSVAVVHHPQAEDLHRAGLAPPGFAEHEHVGVGDRDGLVGDPAERVAVERAAREQVDAQLRPGGG
jgi:hypothetical protein